jgi:ADP-ribose pyrophosphatase YjhB (NUDIX family)
MTEPEDKYADFNEERYFDLKDSFMGYRFCPRCRSELETAELDGRRRLACPSPDCSFIFYQNPIPAAGAVIVQDNAILLVRRAHPPKIGWWSLPAGFMEWDEHPTRTTVRELKEETGLDVELTSLFEVYSGSDDCRNNAVLILYLARIAGGRIEPGDDASEVRFFSFDDLPDNIAFLSHRQAIADYQERFRDREVR